MFPRLLNNWAMMLLSPSIPFLPSMSQVIYHDSTNYAGDDRLYTYTSSIETP